MVSDILRAQPDSTFQSLCSPKLREQTFPCFKETSDCPFILGCSTFPHWHSFIQTGKLGKSEDVKKFINWFVPIHWQHMEHSAHALTLECGNLCSDPKHLPIKPCTHAKALTVLAWASWNIICKVFWLTLHFLTRTDAYHCFEVSKFGKQTLTDFHVINVTFVLLSDNYWCTIEVVSIVLFTSKDSVKIWTVSLHFHGIFCFIF